MDDKAYIEKARSVGVSFSEKRELLSYRMRELWSWALLSVMLLIPFLSDVLNDFIHQDSITYTTFKDNIFLVIIAILLFFLPSLYVQTFNILPLTALFRKVHAYLQESPSTSNLKENIIKIPKGRETLDQLIESEFKLEDRYLLELAVNSRKLAEAIFSRAGAFLFAGSFFALSGMLFFYFSTPDLNENNNSETMIILFAKSFGILLFIEFVAFFFLRLYKSAMDEFRYYESIQRSREETAAIVKLLREKDKEIDVYQLVEKCGFRSGIEKLDSGQTTDLLESKKLTKDETEIFNKILDILGKK